MSLKDLDLAKLSKLTSLQIDHVTCLECCKYLIAPATAACGHTLCHACWRGRRTCPACATHLERKTLKLNIPLQTLTDHVQALGEAFEKLFNIKLDEFNLDTPGEIDSEKDPDKNVKDWLTSSQNHFSAPIQNSETFSQESQQPANPLEVSASNIIIHTDTKKIATPPKVVHIPPPQDDWDKIETMPDPEVTTKKKLNIVGPMDIEPFFVEDSEYTTDHPRRSSRKRDLKNDDITGKVNDLSSNMHSSRSRDSSGDNDKKSQKAKQNWNNVKKMRKEFSKLNKKNRSKLNVSIEMVKKTQNLKPAICTPVATPQAYNIDDNTPNYTNKENEVNNINSNALIDDQQGDNAYQNSAVKSIGKENSIRERVEEADSNSVKKQVEDSINNITPNDHNDENRKNIKEKGNFTGSKHSENQNRTAAVNKMPFIKKSALNPKKTNNFDYNFVQPVASENSDDIEITIKVGNTITNIVIKKKQSDVQVKINTDREVQTSLDPHNSDKNNDYVPKDVNTPNIDINIENNSTKEQEPVIVNINESENIQKPLPHIIQNKNLHVVETNLDRTTSGKKNTASADTGSAQFEITESVEKELSHIMECDVIDDKEESPKSIPAKVPQVNKEQKENKMVEQTENIDDLNDFDIFNSGSVKEANVHILKDHAPSEILGTVRSKFRTQKLAEKRDRDNDEELLPTNKKTKTNPVENTTIKDVHPDSEPINYDAIMGQVFASIDADMEDIRKSQEVGSSSILKDKGSSKNHAAPAPTTNISSPKTQTIKKITSQINVEITPNLNEYFNERQSENVFSIVEKEDENSEIMKTGKITQQVEDFLTPVLCHNLNSTQESNDGIIKTNKTNKSQDYDDDKSVFEETPQKNLSIPKLKRVSTSNQSQISLNETKKVSLRKSTSTIKSIINLTDTVTESNKSSRDVTVIETAVQNQGLETPLTISKFADQIKHKSTPMVRKSLNFENRNDDDDPEQTLCPTTDLIAKTTQEREFMSKAFESTPTTPAARPVTARNLGLNNKRYCLAASCLTLSEIAKVKALCNERKWRHVDKYSKDITHLIVGVDEENKSQRSVKYMCALAASKWIVTFEWVKQCLQTKEIVNEELYEAVDSTGEPGPRRSRIAKQKLFEGITFYCMPPFSVLDAETLKNMLLTAGGRVAADPKLVRIGEDSYLPALVLAEPERTQEDRFTYLAMEQSVVPVNYEWVLNCLGNYTLGSIQELLLCPSSLLPPATAKWPEVLLSHDYDDTNDINYLNE